jgi:type II secretory pathway pseudopilin PulG
LVEVIVVLVILAILAAIAIPALTGYIDKAQDKQYIAQARNAVAALRSVMSELYASGKFGEGLSGSNLDIFHSSGNDSANNLREDYLAAGDHFYDSGPLKYWNPTRVTQIDDNLSSTDPKTLDIFRKSAELIGISYPVNSNYPGFFSILLYAPRNSSTEYTRFNAPAFVYMYFPEGRYKENGVGKPAIVVSYGIDGFTEANTKDWGTFFNSMGALSTHSYNPNAGYQVFHYTSPDGTPPSP